MTTAARLIADLDTALASAGSSVVLNRLGLSAGAPVIAQTVTCNAATRAIGASQASELVGTTAIADEMVIISPTPLLAANWTSGRTGVGEEIVPMRGNQVVIGGRVRAVDSAMAIRLQGTIVRIEMIVVG